MFFHQITRNTLLLLIAIFLNIGIFAFIQQLIAHNHGSNTKNITVNLVDFIYLPKQPEIIKPKKNKSDTKPPSIKQPPSPPKPTQSAINTSKPNLQAPNIDISMSLKGTPYLGDVMKNTIGKSHQSVDDFVDLPLDLNAIPTFKMPPAYPIRALRSGIEGVVTVEFTITTDGSVKDPVIVKAQPEHIFDRSVLRAIKAWKFEPAAKRRAKQDIQFRIER